MINDVKCVSLYLLTISMSSFEKCLLKAFTYVLIEFLVFYNSSVGFPYMFW